MKSLKKTLFLIFILCAFCQSAFAVESPIVMLDKTANQMISYLNRHKANLKNNPRLVYNIVRKVLLPEVDVKRMSRYVLGRNSWKKASSTQRRKFSNEFTKLVVRTYSNALGEYTNETVKFFPIRGGYEGKKRVQVNSRIIRTRGPNIRLSYRVYETKGKWIIYDMSIEGVSILTSFRSQFANELRQGSIEQLIKKLSEQNARYM